MRYQPAYNYPGTGKIVRQPVPEAPRWQVQMPSLDSTDQGVVIKALRILTITFGFLLLIVGGAHFYTAHDAQSWGQQSVTITRADVVRMKYDDAQPIFTARVEYQYEQGGVIITGTRLAVRPITSANPAEVKRHLAGLTVGRSVLAHVNPGEPARAFLTANPDLYLNYLILPGVLLIAISLAIGQAAYIHAERQRRREWRFGDYQTGGFAPAIA